MIKKFAKYIPFIFLVGCAGMQRDCQGCNAESFGANWIIVQYKYDGQPINCWQLRNKAVTNEDHSDGIWWISDEGHLIHISGWYNRAQVEKNDFPGATKELGVDLKRCPGGRYLQEEQQNSKVLNP